MTKREEIDIEALRRICLGTIDSFKSIGAVRDTEDGITVFKDNGSNVLAIAHLDTVQNNSYFEEVSVDIRGQKHRIVYNSSLDDRLGAYTILEYLPKLGINVDVLLTEGEESGRTTARHWSPPNGKTYDWIFSFDRAKCDVVGYQYQDKKWREYVESADLTVGIGSFSDIGAMGYLGVKGYNFGCGYQANHARDAHFFISDYYFMINGFIRFWKKYYKTNMPHVALPKADPWKRYTPNHWTASAYWSDISKKKEDNSLLRIDDDSVEEAEGSRDVKTIENYEVYYDKFYEWIYYEEYCTLWEYVFPHELTIDELNGVYANKEVPLSAMSRIVEDMKLENEAKWYLQG